MRDGLCLMLSESAARRGQLHCVIITNLLCLKFNAAPGRRSLRSRRLRRRRIFDVPCVKVVGLETAGSRVRRGALLFEWHSRSGERYPRYACSRFAGFTDYHWVSGLVLRSAAEAADAGEDGGADF